MNYFAYPSMLLWLIAPAALIVLGRMRARARRLALAALGQPATVIRLLPAPLARRRGWIQSLRVLGLLLIAVALAGPLVGSRLVEFRQRGLDVIIAVDCSLSMQAQDFSPSRLDHAKLVLGQLIDRLAGSRIGVMAFAGQAYLQCPLTIDQNAARDTLDSLDSGSVPIPGTAIGEAVRLAIQGLQAGEGANRVLVLLTDGEDHHSDPLGAAKEAARVGLKIFTIGIGSSQGEAIPVYDEQGRKAGLKRDKKGEVVLSRMDESALQKMAQETGGQYYRADPSGSEVDPLTRVLESIERGDVKTQQVNRFENRFQYPLALGLILLLVSLAIPEKTWKQS